MSRSESKSKNQAQDSSSISERERIQYLIKRIKLFFEKNNLSEQIYLESISVELLIEEIKSTNFEITNKQPFKAIKNFATGLIKNNAIIEDQQADNLFKILKLLVLKIKNPSKNENTSSSENTSSQAEILIQTKSENPASLSKSQLPELVATKILLRHIFYSLLDFSLALEKVQDPHYQADTPHPYSAITTGLRDSSESSGSSIQPDADKSKLNNITRTINLLNKHLTQNLTRKLEKLREVTGVDPDQLNLPISNDYRKSLNPAEAAELYSSLIILLKKIIVLSDIIESVIEPDSKPVLN
jgi:hypothetical protein